LLELVDTPFGRLHTTAIQRYGPQSYFHHYPTERSRVVLENYDDTKYSYLRAIVDSKQLRLEYHPASDGAPAKTPDDFVTVDLATRKPVHYQPAG
jgi:hypothetical protein